MAIDSIKKLQDAYRRTLDEGAWFERLMQSRADAYMRPFPGNSLALYLVEILENDRRLNYILEVEFTAARQIVSFSMLSGDSGPGVRRTLAKIALSIQDAKPNQCCAFLDRVYESKLRDLLNLREKGMPIDETKIDRSLVEIPISDSPRVRDIAVQMIQLRGTPHEPTLAALCHGNHRSAL